MSIEDQALAGAIAVGLTQAATHIGLPSRFAPLVALACGVGAVFLILGTVTTDGALWGIIAGLSSAGLYSGVKATAGK